MYSETSSRDQEIQLELSSSWKVLANKVLRFREFGSEDWPEDWEDRWGWDRDVRTVFLEITWPVDYWTKIRFRDHTPHDHRLLGFWFWFLIWICDFVFDFRFTFCFDRNVLFFFLCFCVVDDFHSFSLIINEVVRCSQIFIDVNFFFNLSCSLFVFLMIHFVCRCLCFLFCTCVCWTQLDHVLCVLLGQDLLNMAH